MRHHFLLAAILAVSCQAGPLYASAPKTIPLDGYWNFIPDPSNSVEAAGLGAILDSRPDAGGRRRA